MAALQADLQATEGLFQAGRNGGGGETTSPIPRSIRLDVPKSQTLVTTGILESKPTTLGDAFSLAHITKARLGDQEVSSVSNTTIVNSGGRHNQKNNVELVKPALWTTPPKPTCNLDEDAEADQDNLKDQGDTLKSGDTSTLNSLVRNESRRSLQLWGTIGSGNIHVLIDNGSTHNFVQPVGINMQGLAMEVDLYVLPRKGPDVVLGIQWLQKLGKVTHDYVEWIMEFILEGVTHTLWDPGIKIFLDETLRARWFRRSGECYAPSLVIFVMFD
ncbi:major facilitator superfamily domain protein [Tanacetum coccineum]